MRVLNSEIYERYKRSIRERRDDAYLVEYAQSPPATHAPGFLQRLVYLWNSRYSDRVQAFTRWSFSAPKVPALDDKGACDILIARNRLHNERFRTMPLLPKKQFIYLEHIFRAPKMDVADLAEIPMYGPSFLTLWARRNCEVCLTKTVQRTSWSGTGMSLLIGTGRMSGNRNVCRWSGRKSERNSRNRLPGVRRAT